MGIQNRIIQGQALIVWKDESLNLKMDDIDTDQITPSDYCITPHMDRMDHYWKKGAFLHLIKDFKGQVSAGKNFLVVGDRFGIGSSREMSPASLMAVARDAGLELVILCGTGVASIFLRNAVNLGLMVVQCPKAVEEAREGNCFSFETHGRILKNLTLGTFYTPIPLNATDQAILDAGGLISMGRRALDEPLLPKPFCRTTQDDPGITLTRELVNSHRVDPGESFFRGDRIRVACDLLPASDGTAPFAIYAFEQTIQNRESIPKNIAIIFDHFVFTGDENHQSQSEISKAFLGHYQIPSRYYTTAGDGIFHIVLPERGLVRPGDVVAGADSHTRSLGAYGVLGFGVGSTELGVGWATGFAFFTIGSQVKIRFKGRLSPWVSGKDIALSLISQGNALGLRGSNIEFVDKDQGLSMADRHTLCNMMAEAEAISAVFALDDVTTAWYRERHIEITGDRQPLDRKDCLYDLVKEVDLSNYTPMVALPFHPSNVTSPGDPAVKDIPIQKVFIGSCTNGMYSDLLRAAMVISKSCRERVAPHVELLVYPGSRDIFARCQRPDKALGGQKVLEVLENAGALVRPSWCGPCFGQGRDKLGPGQTAVATFNRNWKNRSGLGGRVILSSPETAAASALKGFLDSPVYWDK
ncbi:MAG: hypothetical protein KKC20_09995 [Proteobacteria bacterium]|nr:hypothetical protein [Pseudomonadota bacterium]